MTRQIKGLKWAKRLAERPSCIPQGRPRGVKASGVRYERQLARALPWGTHGQWWEFEDAEGRGYCQTDVIVERPEWVLVLEAKLSWTGEAHLQLEELYKPVVSAALRKPCWGVQVCLRLLPGTPKGVVSGSLPGALRIAREGKMATFHWLGKSAIVGLEMPKAASPTGPLLRGSVVAHIDAATRAGL